MASEPAYDPATGKKLRLDPSSGKSADWAPDCAKLLRNGYGSHSKDGLTCYLRTSGPLAYVIAFTTKSVPSERREFFGLGEIPDPPRT